MKNTAFYFYFVMQFFQKKKEHKSDPQEAYQLRTAALNN